MRTKEELLIAEIEGLSASEVDEFGRDDENIRLLWVDVQKLLKELKIVTKVGRFDDFYDREAPRIFSKLLAKKNELLDLIDFEKRKSGEMIPPPTPREDSLIPGIKGTANPALLTPTSVRSSDPHQKFLIRNLLAYADDNLHMMVIFGLVIIGLQIVFNFAFVARVKNNMQSSVVEPLEERLKASEQQNAELTRNLAGLQKQVAFLQSVSLRPPELTTKTHALTTAKKTQIVHQSSKTGKRTAQNKYSRY